jgi:hypothetical protein
MKGFVLGLVLLALFASAYARLTAEQYEASLDALGGPEKVKELLEKMRSSRACDAFCDDPDCGKFVHRWLHTNHDDTKH